MTYQANVHKVRLCPLAEEQKNLAFGYGGADKAWSWQYADPTVYRGGYTINGWFYSDDASTKSFHRESNVQHPVRTPVFGDGMFVDAWPMATDPPARNLYLQTWPADGGINRYTMARHSGKGPKGAPKNVAPGQKLTGAIEVSFTDGHVELARLESLWSYEWHRDYKAPAKRPN